MKPREDESYWNQACHLFRNSGFADDAGSYVIHNKNTKTVKVGVMSQVAVAVCDGHVDHTEHGQPVDGTAEPADASVFRHVERLLRRDAPCFLLVSPDIKRRFVDTSVPQILALQPALELAFSPDRSQGEVSYAEDPASEQRGVAMLRASAEAPHSPLPDDSGEPRSFAELADGWVPAEDDESFLSRLGNAVRVLQDHPDGKLTLTRAYERRLAGDHSPFALYERHARLNGEYACSHFVCIRPGVFSLGTTPENVFEISGRTLTVDVVAGTCKASDDGDYLAQELYENPKQIKEHNSSLANRQNRFKPFCKGGSIRAVQDMQVKTLRNVCHLHSVFAGELLPDVSMFDLVANIFPLLGARPKELLPLADSETAPHRYYGGVVGHLHGTSGCCFLNIRNALLKDDVIYAKVGTGVIRESDSYSELVETRNKLSGVLEAVRLWEQADARSGQRLHASVVSER
jgi:anthranilate/para-aminobenzoate synthase component I